jgi:alpha-glucosidase
MAHVKNHAWWQSGIIYQVYPRSFADSNGDGVGDLQGVRSRLDYLEWLGIDAIWLSPFYPSPMADFGYDISDYTGIHPLFGTMADFDALVADAHRRNIRVILDLVPNHTSDQHPWFQEARSSRTSPRRDWYIWHDGKPDGSPPNNWRSMFGGSAWQWDETTKQYYYHAFLTEQPDLNWRNPDVQKAMFDVMRFWLERGVDGFRVDVIYHIIKDDQFRDNPLNPHYQPTQPSFDELNAIYTTDRPEVIPLIEKMRQVVDSYGERVLIGEVYLPTERLMAYYGPEANAAHMPYNFQLILLPWEARTIDAAVGAYEAALPKNGWPNWVLGNHDQKRVATRVGKAQARNAAMLLLTLRGTPTMYYGDEIGMENVSISPERIQDPFEKREPGKGNGRDPERTPMQWSAAPGAGFTTGHPWLPLADDYQQVNVDAQQADAGSLLSLTRSVIQLRRTQPALSIGTHEPVHADGELLAYRRREGSQLFLVVLNLCNRPEKFTLPADLHPAAEVVLSTVAGERVGEKVNGTDLLLRADEGLLIRESN